MKAVRKHQQVIRWACVLPGACLACLTVTLSIHGLATVAVCDRPESFSGLAASFLGPLVFILVGARIAPGFHFQTALGLATVWAILYVAIVTIVVYKHADVWGWVLLSFLLTVEGVLIGVEQYSPGVSRRVRVLSYLRKLRHRR